MLYLIVDRLTNLVVDRSPSKHVSGKLMLYDLVDLTIAISSYA